MKAKAHNFEPEFSADQAVLPAARTFAPHTASPVADLHRLLADHFDNANPALDGDSAQAQFDRITGGVSRAAGIVSLIAGYAATGYIVSVLFF